MLCSISIFSLVQTNTGQRNLKTEWSWLVSLGEWVKGDPDRWWFSFKLVSDANQRQHWNLVVLFLSAVIAIDLFFHESWFQCVILQVWKGQGSRKWKHGLNDGFFVQFESPLVRKLWFIPSSTEKGKILCRYVSLSLSQSTRHIHKKWMSPHSIFNKIHNKHDYSFHSIYK